MLLVLDFDGTLADGDCLDLIVRTWAPEAWEHAETQLLSGQMTLNEVIAYEFERVHATRDELLAFLRERVALRAGLPELIDFCRERFVEPVVLSSGFRELIEPLLRDHGVALPVLANSARFSSAGATVTFSERGLCQSCEEPCKRTEVVRLAAGRLVGYVGDGWSDRCGVEVADVIFARDSLARHLEERDRPYVPFEDLHDVRHGLGRYLAA